MLCQLCGKRTANVCINIDINGTKTRRFICEQCAEKRKLRENPTGAAILALMNDIRAANAENGSDSNENEDKCCSSCGIHYKDFARTSELGCPDCYESFSDELIPILQSITKPPQSTAEPVAHNNATVSRQDDIMKLKHILEQCVEREDYENAAKLRDKIAQLEAEEREVQQNDSSK